MIYTQEALDIQNLPALKQRKATSDIFNQYIYCKLNCCKFSPQANPMSVKFSKSGQMSMTNWKVHCWACQASLFTLEPVVVNTLLSQISQIK